MAKRWRILPHDAERIAALERAIGVPAVVAQLLVSRQITNPSQAREFLDPRLTLLRDPETLPGCAAAAERIHEALRAGRKIVVHGDYDVDGIAGTAILWLCLKMLGAEVSYHVPHRIDDGYGLNCDTVRQLAAQGAGLIVTVDCGITSVAEAALAQQLGVELIISDHHEPGAELPAAAAVVHPRLPGGGYPFGSLSGSGVAFKLAWSLCQAASGAKRVGARMKDFLLQAVGLAALGTVADVVPLLDENRVLVRHGLVSLAERPTVGMATLMDVAKIDRSRPLNTEDVAFTLAPRLNAAGRLGQPRLAVELLITDRQDRAAELAQYIDQLNASRQTLERSIYLAAGKQIKLVGEDSPAFVLADRDWHAGVIGIVAGRLADKHARPVVLISWDQLGVKPGIGSARSVPGFNLHAALQSCSRHLVTHGGHAAAAGLRIEESSLDLFRAEFCEYVAAELDPKACCVDLVIDGEAPLSAFTLNAVEQIERLAPFGEGNHRPLLCTSGATLVEPPRTIGGGGRHLSLRVAQHGVTFRAVAFGGAERAEELAPGASFDIAFRPVINHYRGRHNVELQLVDWQAAARA
jgi:single-stranded-DNA-specific exonuclease